MFRGVARFLANKPRRSYAAVVALLALAVTSALLGVWVFEGSPDRGSVWALILTDRWALGFLRLAIVLGGGYVAGSAIAHLVSGRWIKALSTSGIEVDPRDIDQRIEKHRIRVEELTRERDLAYRLLGEYLGG